MNIKVLVGMVRALAPGKELTLNLNTIENSIAPRNLTPDGLWNAADQVLEKVVGSAFEYGYRTDPTNRKLTFFRLPQPLPADGDTRTFVSPDRRHYFDIGADGFYRMKKQRAKPNLPPHMDQ